MIYDKYDYTIPEGMGIRVITNTDAKNEGDDQYAIVHTLLSPRFDNIGIIAAHFGQIKSQTTMEDSYDEVIKLLDMMDFDRSLAVKGAPHKLPDENTPVPSVGAQLIIDEALKDDDRPLFVTFMGPLTDLASAYLMEPKIAGRLTAIWIGGGEYPDGGREYNLSNDIEAVNVIFKSDIDIWQVPRNVYQLVMVSLAELQKRVKPCGELGKYLFEQLEAWGHTKWALKPPRTGECWCLGDSPVVGLMLYEHPYRFDWVNAPTVNQDMSYTASDKNRPIRVYNYVDSRFIMEDFYAKLELFTEDKN